MRCNQGMLRKRDMGQGRAGEGGGKCQDVFCPHWNKKRDFGTGCVDCGGASLLGSKERKLWQPMVKLVQLWRSVDPSTDAGAKFRGNKKLASNENQAKFAPLRR